MQFHFRLRENRLYITIIYLRVYDRDANEQHCLPIAIIDAPHPIKISIMNANCNKLSLNYDCLPPSAVTTISYGSLEAIVPGRCV